MRTLVQKIDELLPRVVPGGCVTADDYQLISHLNDGEIKSGDLLTAQRARAFLERRRSELTKNQTLTPYLDLP